ncbi:MAG: hypothetical protein R3Y63_10360 [Eubacteriales bacterium]
MKKIEKPSKKVKEKKVKDKKTGLSLFLSAGAGLVLGILGSSFYWNSQQEPHPLVTATTTGGAVASVTSETTQASPTPKEVLHPTDSWNLLQTAFLAVNAIESNDYTTLSQMVHKEKGVRFTPFSTVNLENDIVLSAEDIKGLVGNATTYSWGSYVGSEEVVSLNIADYFQKFVNHLSYSKAPYIAIDSVILSGNALENVAEAYPDCRFVDFSFRSIDPELGGLDWSSLKLVFEIHQDAWYLVGMVHSEWTV